MALNIGKTGAAPAKTASSTAGTQARGSSAAKFPSIPSDNPTPSAPGRQLTKGSQSDVRKGTPRDAAASSNGAHNDAAPTAQGGDSDKSDPPSGTASGGSVSPNSPWDTVVDDIRNSSAVPINGASTTANGTSNSASASISGRAATADAASNPAPTVSSEASSASPSTPPVSTPATKVADTKAARDLAIASKASAARPGSASAPRKADASDPKASLLQTLAQSVAPQGVATAAATSPDASAASNPDSDDHSESQGEPDAAAIALASQSLMASMGLPAMIQPQTFSSTNTAAGGLPDTSATDATAQGGGAIKLAEMGGKSLLASLARDIADTSTKATDPTQATVPGQDPGGDPNTASQTSSTTQAAISPAQLGLTPHLAVQHTHSDPRTVAGELRSPVATSAWNDELGGHLTWMAHQGVESASLKLSPEHLGPLEIHISVNAGDASVWFGAQQADTRAALEHALPHLREMFAAQGLTLADANVSREPPRQQANSSSAQGVAAISSVGSTDGSVSAATRARLGLVDTYA